MLPGSTSGTWVKGTATAMLPRILNPPNGRFESEFPVFQGWFSGSEPFIFCFYFYPIKKKQSTQVILSPRPENKFSIEFGSRLFSPSQHRSPSQKLPGKKLIPLGLAIITEKSSREKNPKLNRRIIADVQAKSVGCEMILVMCFYPIWNLFKRLPSPGWNHLRIMQVNSTGFLIPVAPLEKYDKRIHGRLPLKRHRVMIVTLCKRLPWEVNFLIYLSKKCQWGTKYIRKFKKKLTKQKSHLTWYCLPTVPTTGSYREASQRLFHLFHTFRRPAEVPRLNDPNLVAVRGPRWVAWRRLISGT